MLTNGKLFIGKDFILHETGDGVYNAKIILENAKSVNKKIVILN